MTGDAINPEHYKASASGVECIEVTRWLSFNLGNATKYLWRCGMKDDPGIEIGKAIWYLSDEIDRLANPVAHWIRPIRHQQWASDFGKHLDTLGAGSILESLHDIREAVLEQNLALLRSARHRLRTWELEVSEVS